MLLAWLAVLPLAVSARWSYEDAYDNVADGDWYRDADNETATLAWGESYVMASLAAMYRVTGDPMYLDRLAWHADGVLEQRDDARGVSDYRGISGACWRNMSYQDGAYCYAVHTGMLIHPMLEFVEAVRASPYADELAYDGESFGAKAEAYLAAAQESIAFHEFEWNPAGYYVFAADASFLDYAGSDQPLNQSNALGRALLLYGALTGDADATAKATALAARLRAMMTVAGDGAYLWNYWGGAYAGNGEDVSHAAINVDFAVQAARRGVVFDAADLEGLAATFVQRVYVDDGTIRNAIGGGPTNDGSYRPQVGRWLSLTPTRTAVYTAVRDLYDEDYAPAGVGSGSLLLAWALLAEYEPPLCAPFFYVVDWDDQGEARQATAYGANILTTPPQLDAPCRVPVRFDAARTTTVAQWDGEAYHRVATWRAQAATRHVPYEPRWPFVYADDGVLFEFEDAFVEGEGIVVDEPDALVLPSIAGSPPDSAELDIELAYQPSGAGDLPLWWSLADAPASARIDAASGALTWTPTAPGSYAFTVQLDNDVGAVQQSFVVTVAGDDASDSSAGEGEPTSSSDGTTTVDGDGTTAGDGEGGSVTGDGEGGNTPGARDDVDAGGCACASAAPSRPGPHAAHTTHAMWLPWLLAVVRRRRDRGTGPTRRVSRTRER